MRILVFLPFLGLGGAEKQGVIVARYLIGRGHEVDVWGFASSQSESKLFEYSDLRFEELPLWPSLEWNIARRRLPLSLFERNSNWNPSVQAFVETLPERQFDVIIPFTFWPSLIANLARAQLGAKKCFWNHRGGYDAAGISYNRFLKNRVLECYPQFAANSSAGAMFLQDKFSLSPGCVTTIPNAYVPRAGTQRLNRKTKNHLNLIHVANFFPEKDYDTALRAVRILKGRGITCMLHICGRFNADADAHQFFGRIAELGVEESIAYHGGVSTDSVADLMRQSDIGLLSSRSEGQPNSIMEYMGHNLPVVATNIHGNRELLGPENVRWLFEVGDAERLARLIGELSRDSELRSEIGIHNRTRVTEQFAPERILPRWAELVEN